MTKVKGALIEDAQHDPPSVRDFYVIERRPLGFARFAPRASRRWKIPKFNFQNERESYVAGRS